MALGGWKSYAMMQRYAHLSPDNAAAAARTVGTLVAQALKGKKNRPERKRQSKPDLDWWVLTGSNRRPSPCKGTVDAMLPVQFGESGNTGPRPSAWHDLGATHSA
jgi:hypothetical protein